MIPFVKAEALVWLKDSRRDVRLDIRYAPNKKLYYQGYIIESINYPMTNPKSKWKQVVGRDTYDHALYCIAGWKQRPEKRYRIRSILDGNYL